MQLRQVQSVCADARTALPVLQQAVLSRASYPGGKTGADPNQVAVVLVAVFTRRWIQMHIQFQERLYCSSVH